MQILSFDAEAGILLVELPSFPTYEVFDVPADVFDKLQRSKHPDAYFNQNIWGNHFEHNSHWKDIDTLLDYMSKYMMFDHPCAVTSQTYDGDTPLHTACVWGDIGAVDLLIAAGADVNAKGDLATTPICNAVSFRRVRCVERLIKAGASVDDKNELASTARESARRSGDQYLIHLIEAAR